MKIIELKHGNSSAQVYAYGATVTSWKQNGKEKLFLSSTGNEIFKPGIHGPKPARYGLDGWVSVVPGNPIYKLRVSKAGWFKSDSRWDTGSFPEFRSMEAGTSAWICSNLKLDS